MELINGSIDSDTIVRIITLRVIGCYVVLVQLWEYFMETVKM